MDTHYQNEAEAGDGAAVAAHSAARTDAAAPSTGAAPFSKTGRKIESDQTVLSGESCAANFDPEFQSERIQFFTDGKKSIIQQHPIPNALGKPSAAIVDWLAFTLRPPAGESHAWVIHELRRQALVGIVDEMKGGYAGYANKAQCAEDKNRLCLIAWGGKNQAGTIYVSFTGHGCARILDWAALRAWLEQVKATITRLDLAYDDFKSERLSITAAVEWYRAGGFNAGGRTPEHSVSGDWLNGDQSRRGRTLYVGSRESGKLFRLYEKGKQLGDPESAWVRAEVEWHNQDRVIPYAALTEPGRYISGAYQCLRFLSDTQSRIGTTQRAAKTSFKRAMENGRRSVGKLVNLALDVYEGDYGEVVEQLRRDGYPARIEPYSFAFAGEPALLAKAD